MTYGAVVVGNPNEATVGIDGSDALDELAISLFEYFRVEFIVYQK